MASAWGRTTAGRCCSGEVVRERWREKREEGEEKRKEKKKEKEKEKKIWVGGELPRVKFPPGAFQLFNIPI